MLSPQLRRKVHDLWSLFWSSGLSNPLVAVEQITYLLFIRQLEALDRDRVAHPIRVGTAPVRFCGAGTEAISDGEATPKAQAKAGDRKKRAGN